MNYYSAILVWWALTWRYMVIGFIAGAVAGTAAGIVAGVLESLGYEVSAKQAIFQLAGALAGACCAIVVTKSLFSGKPFGLLRRKLIFTVTFVDSESEEYLKSQGIGK
ncbi:MAG: hypothetical protein OXR68_03845 [Alphaproteobacteria bacterium]|nr:hypothetical protein [Alphaproteobacteria bacterium]MDD9919738.1 hypothetical protein [Alphaproteobacteria bacterium]